MVPEKKSRLVIADGFNTLQSPSVEYRGVFLNDEDWTLRPWSTYNYEPGGRLWNIGPKTNKRVFQLLLRLRANAVWPAMHTGTPGFFTIPGNREMPGGRGLCGKIYPGADSAHDAGAKPDDVHGDIHKKISENYR